MKIFVVKKWQFYRGPSKDLYNKIKLMVKKWNDNNLLDTLKKNSQFQNFGILKLWKWKICTLENLISQKFNNVLLHINVV